MMLFLLFILVVQGEEILTSKEVEFGKAFPLTVVRTWDTGQEPKMWSEKRLAPLVVRLMETTRRENEETLDYQCYAFTLEEITLPEFDLTIRVKSALKDDTPVELPGQLMPEPASPFPWWLGGIAVLAVFLIWFMRRPREVPVPPPPAPHVRALERLGRLREQHPITPMEIDAYYVEASQLVRDYIGQRFEVRAPEMTTEQIMGALEAEQLNEFLFHCDLVKFGRHLPTPPDREKQLDSAQRFLEETAQ